MSNMYWFSKHHFHSHLLFSNTISTKKKKNSKHNLKNDLLQNENVFVCGKKFDYDYVAPTRCLIVKRFSELMENNNSFFPPYSATIWKNIGFFFLISSEACFTKPVTKWILPYVLTANSLITNRRLHQTPTSLRDVSHNMSSSLKQFFETINIS